MSDILGFSKRHPYLLFEDAITKELILLSQTEIDPNIKEMIRIQILKTRCWCRDYWIATGQQIPPNIRFVEE